MAEEEKTAPEPTPAEERAIALEKIREVLRYAVVDTEDGPQLDLDQLCRLLNQRAVGYRVLNRELMAGELGIVRAEQDTQRVRSEKAEREEDRVEAASRLGVLEARERHILDLLWPLP